MKNIILPILILLISGCGKKIESGNSANNGGDELNPTAPPMQYFLNAGVDQEGNTYSDFYEHTAHSDCVKFPETLSNLSGNHDQNSWLSVSIEGSIYVTCEYELNNNQFEIYDCYDKRQNSVGILARGYIYREDRVKFEIRGTQTASLRNVEFPVELDNCGAQY